MDSAPPALAGSAEIDREIGEGAEVVQGEDVVTPQEKQKLAIEDPEPQSVGEQAGISSKVHIEIEDSDVDIIRYSDKGDAAKLSTTSRSSSDDSGEDSEDESEDEDGVDSEGEGRIGSTEVGTPLDKPGQEITQPVKPGVKLTLAGMSEAQPGAAKEVANTEMYDIPDSPIGPHVQGNDEGSYDSVATVVQEIASDVDPNTPLPINKDAGTLPSLPLKFGLILTTLHPPLFCSKSSSPFGIMSALKRLVDPVVTPLAQGVPVAVGSSSTSPWRYSASRRRVTPGEVEWRGFFVPMVEVEFLEEVWAEHEEFCTEAIPDGTPAVRSLMITAVCELLHWFSSHTVKSTQREELDHFRRVTCDMEVLDFRLDWVQDTIQN